MALTLLCIATYRKGDEFLRECRRQGCRVLLLTDETLRDADWPREAIDEMFYLRRGMPEEEIRKGAAALARRERIDRIVALDDFDVELAAMLREYFIPGDVFHVDSIVFDHQVVFAVASRYGAPPMTVAHEGGIFLTRTLADDDPAARQAIEMSGRVLSAFGLVRGVSHTECIR